MSSNTYLPGTITIPSSLIIENITQALKAVVTVSVDPVTEALTYIRGQTIKFRVPSVFGMQQINGLIGKISFVDGFNITVDIDSSLFDPFITSPTTKQNLPTIAPYGSNNLQFNNITGWEPFQSLNDRGN